MSAVDPDEGWNGYRLGDQAWARLPAATLLTNPNPARRRLSQNPNQPTEDLVEPSLMAALAAM